MSKKTLSKRSYSTLWRLEEVEVLSCVYGLDGLMHQAQTYTIEIRRAVSQNDKSLCCSALKLASRFLCTASCVLIERISRDMVQLRYKGSRIDVMIRQIKRLSSYL